MATPSVALVALLAAGRPDVSRDVLVAEPKSETLNSTVEYGLREFVRESNRIEGIEREPTTTEIEAHKEFLRYKTITVPRLKQFVSVVAGASLRDQPGMDVRIGSHVPIPGGPRVRELLDGILFGVNHPTWDLGPYSTHLDYEELHPFTDGNGRSGRVLWAWQMQRDGLDPFGLPFLWRWYYQTLDTSTRTQSVQGEAE